MTKPRILLMLVALLTASGSAPGFAQSPNVLQPNGAGQQAFSLKIAAIPDVIRAGSPVNVEILTTNTSDHQITLAYIYTAGFPVSWGLDVRDAKGDKAPGTAFSRELKAGFKIVRNNVVPLTGNSYYPPLKAGEAVLNKLGADAIYDMTKPCKYTIQVSRFDPESKTEVKSNTVNVTVEESSEFIKRQATGGVTISLAISPLQQVIKAGSDLSVPIYTINMSDHEILFDCGMYSVKVYDSQGNLLPWIGGPETRRIQEKGIGRSCSIPAYATVAGQLSHVNKLYDLITPGKYTIQASKFDEESKTLVKSNIITMTVVP